MVHVITHVKQDKFVKNLDSLQERDHLGARSRRRYNIMMDL